MPEPSPDPTLGGLPAPRGSVPQLRLMAALHELVLAGGVPELARAAVARRPLGGRERRQRLQAALAIAARDPLPITRVAMEPRRDHADGSA